MYATEVVIFLASSAVHVCRWQRAGNSLSYRKNSLFTSTSHYQVFLLVEHKVISSSADLYYRQKIHDNWRKDNSQGQSYFHLLSRVS